MVEVKHTGREPWHEMEEWKRLLIEVKHGARMDWVDSDRMATVIGGLSFRIEQLKNAQQAEMVLR